MGGPAIITFIIKVTRLQTKARKLWLYEKKIRARKQCGTTGTPNTDAWHSLPYSFEHRYFRDVDRNLASTHGNQINLLSDYKIQIPALLPCGLRAVQF